MISDGMAVYQIRGAAYAVLRPKVRRQVSYEPDARGAVKKLGSFLNRFRYKREKNL